MNPRLIAARVIDSVTDGHSLTETLPVALVPVKDARDRAFIQAICFGVCRYYACLDVILGELLQKPMKGKDSDVHALLMVGLYQLIYMRVPPHAAVAETVNASQALNKSWARGLINAVLREYLRQEATLAEKIKADPEAHYAHPLWWIGAIKKAWPNDYDAILEANNAHPPFALRVNTRLTSRADYLAAHAGISIPETNSGFVLEEPIPVEEVAGFTAGQVSVQDGAAQLAAEILALAPGQRVLDACAAPGGKLTHLLEWEPALLACVAVEIDARRMASIKENLTRLHLKATLICGDAAATEEWWDGQLFDRILLDAPCSASGVIRRHPDIKLLREPNDIKALAVTQLAILQALWPLLKPGGVFVYATCSIFPEENEHVIQAFMATVTDAKISPIEATWGLPLQFGRQILPGMHNMDGFYYARLVKLGMMSE